MIHSQIVHCTFFLTLYCQSERQRKWCGWCLQTSNWLSYFCSSNTSIGMVQIGQGSKSPTKSFINWVSNLTGASTSGNPAKPSLAGSSSRLKLPKLTYLSFMGAPGMPWPMGSSVAKLNSWPQPPPNKAFSSVPPETLPSQPHIILSLPPTFSIMILQAGHLFMLGGRSSSLFSAWALMAPASGGLA